MTADPGLARHWKWHFNESAMHAGQQVWSTPDIVSLNAWLERLWEQSLLAGGTAGRLNLLSSRQSRFVGESQLRDTTLQAILSGRSSVVRRVMQGWRLCREWGISTRELEATAVSQDERLFADWALGYELRVSERGWVDPWSVPRLVCEDLDSGVIELPGPVRFIGFYTITPQLQRITDVLKRLGRFAGWGFDLVSDPDGNACRVACTDNDDERRRIASWVRQLRDNDPRASIGIVLPKITQHAADLRRELLDTIAPGWRFGAAGRLVVSTVGMERLADTGLVHTALIALRVPLGKMDYRDFGQLLRSPYLRGVDTEANARAILDIVCRERKFHEIDLRAVIEADSARGDAAVPQMMDILRAGLAIADSSRGRRERKEPGDWVATIDQYLRKIGWGKGRVLMCDEHRTIEAWQSLLEQFAALNEFIGRIEFNHAVGLIAALCQDQLIRDDAGDNAVQILSMADAADYRFDGLWCAGLTSEAWPLSPRANPLIAVLLQRDRGIPEADPGVYRQTSAKQLGRLMAAAPDMVMSWAGEGDDTMLAPSPILESLPEASSEQAPKVCNKTSVSGDTIFEVLDCDTAPPVCDPGAIRGGSRVLNLQSHCPARAFFEIRLGAKPLRVPPFGIDGAWRGNIFHDALEELYQRLKAFGGPQKSGEENIRTTIDTAAKLSLNRHVPRSHPLSNALRHNEFGRLVRLLGEVVDTDRQRPPFTIVGLEAKHLACIGELKLNLRIDRIDQLESGQKMIIDYKTGRAFSMDKWRGERPGEPQLPLYAVTGDADAIALIKIDEKVSLVGVGATDIEISGIIAPDKFGGSEWTEVVAQWGYWLEHMVTEFMAGDVRIDAQNNNEACGEFAMLTRVHSSLRVDD